MNYAIILASGKGKRAGNDIPKQFVEINGKTILEYTIEAFEKNTCVDKIILVVNKEYLDFCKKFKFKKLENVVKGGIRRQDSSRIGVNTVKENDANILIHDGARPFIKDETINRCFDALKKYDAIVTGIESTDTVIQINEQNIMTNTLKRDSLIRCQTPQGFKSGLIKKAHEMAKESNLEVTDDTGLVIAFNLSQIYVVKGDKDNIKITYPEDIKRAKEFFAP